MLKVVSAIPAKQGLTGASLALVHVLLGVLRKTNGRVRITVVTSASAMRYPAFRRLVKAGAVCHILNIDRFPSKIYWLMLALKLAFSGRHDIAHFSTPKTFLLMYPAALLAASRTVLTLEGYAPYELADARLLSRLLGIASWLAGLKLADRVAACSEWLRKIVELSHGFGWKLSTVHNPIDHERFTCTAQKNSVGPVVVVARLHQVKGVDTALKAIACLREKRGSTPKLQIIGDGVERKRLEKMANELGIAGNVEFLGHRYDVENYVKNASLVLVPSRYEPFGMPAAEAAAAGKPVIASSAGGLKEIVDDGVTGFLFAPDDHEDLAEKTAKLLDDPGLTVMMGNAARKKALEKFTPEAVAAQMLKDYLSALRWSSHRR
ncbi:MAG: glycosyltransferase family 4 protein [Candidatus Caldarchaeum sp.]